MARLRLPHGRSWSRLICLSTCLLLAGGCVATQRQKMARFRPESSAGRVARVAPDSGVYKVKWRGGEGDEWKTLEGTKRIVRRGQRLGFESAPDGGVVAVAGNERFLLVGLPASAEQCAWYVKTEEETPFSKEVKQFARTVAGAVATGAVFVGVVALHAAADSLSHDHDGCDDCRRGRCRRHRDGRRRERGSDSAPDTKGSSGG